MPFPNKEQTIHKALGYLTTTQRSDGRFDSYLSRTRNFNQLDPCPLENFSTILIARLLMGKYQETSILQNVAKNIGQFHENNIFHFYTNRSFLPPDTDTTALGNSFLYEIGLIEKNRLNQVCHALQSYMNREGKMQTFITHEERSNRFDHVVATNVLYMFYLCEQEKCLEKTEDWIFDTLITDMFLRGSRYYPSADSFLYFLNVLCQRFSHAKKKFGHILARKIVMRLGSTERPLDLAMRVIIARSLNIECLTEINKLNSLQEINGSWPNDVLFKYGSRLGYFSSPAVNTAFAIGALS